MVAEDINMMMVMPEGVDPYRGFSADINKQ